jgi:hypothetical protein
MYYLLLKAAEILQGQALTIDEDVTTFSEFMILLKHHQNLLIGDAKYQINKS